MIQGPRRALPVGCLIIFSQISSAASSLCRGLLLEPGAMAYSSYQLPAHSPTLPLILGLDDELLRAHTQQLFALLAPTGRGKSYFTTELFHRLRAIQQPAIFIYQTNELDGYSKTSGLTFALHSRLTTAPLSTPSHGFYRDLFDLLSFVYKKINQLPDQTVLLIDTQAGVEIPRLKSERANEKMLLPRIRPEELLKVWSMLVDLASSGRVIPVIAAGPEVLDILAGNWQGRAILRHTHVIQF